MRTSRPFPWKRAAGIGLLALLAALLIFIAIANYAYYTPRPADRPCQGCTGEARAVSVDGFDLYYRELGAEHDLPPVVVVHGGPGHSSLSFKQAFDFLSAGRRVIYYDQRGSGSSQSKPDPALYTVEALVEELETLRREVIGADRIVLVGHSAGGALAQRYALQYPQHLDSLVLVSSIQINNAVSAAALWDVFGPVLFTAGAGFPPAQPDQANAWFTGLMLTTSQPRLYDPERIDLIENSGEVSFAAWREVSRSLSGPDYRSELSSLPVRTLVLYGAADADYTGPEKSAELCALLPDCTLHGFEHSGHWPFLEEPDAFASALTSFLEGSGE